MEYEYVKGLLNIDTSMSTAMSLWKHYPTGQYYISPDGLRNITPVTNNQYMLLYEEPKPMYSQYRDRLTNPKLVSQKEFASGYVEYNNSVWRLNNFLNELF